MPDAKMAPVDVHAYADAPRHARSEQVRIVYHTQEPGTPPGNWIYWTRIGVVAVCALFWAVVIFFVAQYFQLMPGK